jgi:hypothetical protein
VDQAALHGLLTKVRDLGLLLISVRQIDPNASQGAAVGQRHHQRGDGQ